MRKALWTICLTGLFLLLLSALVVTPEDALPREPVPPLPANAPVFVVAAPAPAALPADRETAGTEMRFFFALLAVPFLAAANPAHKHDSNGRVLTSARYENSVYQLFRPEVAGG